ncbi:hypothetical protein Tco_0482038 [Tanacetum coccineum]
MDITRAQQVALDDALVAPTNRLTIGKTYLSVGGLCFIQAIETSNVKRSNEMYYPRFTKVIVNFFMTKDPSIPRRNMPSNKAIASGAEPPKTKASVKKKQAGSDKTKTPPTAKGKRLKTSAKVAKPAKQKQPAKTSKAKGLTVLYEVALTEAKQIKLATKRSLIQTHSSHAQLVVQNKGTMVGKPGIPMYAEHMVSDDEQISGSSSDEEKDDDNDEVTQDGNVDGEELNEETYENEEVNELYKDVNVNLEGRDTEMTDAQQTNVQGTHVIEDTHVIMTAVAPEVQQQSSSVSSCFISNMLNPNPNTCIDSILNLNTESTSLVDVPISMTIEMPLSFATTIHPPPIGVKALEDNFSKFKQTNQFAIVVSLIPDIIDTYLANKMNEVVKTVVQLQSDRLKDEAQAKNADFINKLNDNIKKIIKEQVKAQVKEQVTKILPRIKKTINEQLKVEILTRSSNEAKTSHVIAANLSKLELKKILIDKMENLRDDPDEDRRTHYSGSNTGVQEKKSWKKEPESTIATKRERKTSNSSSKSKEGSKSHHTSTGKSAHAEEQIQANKDLEEPARQEFDTGFSKDQTVDETTQHHNCRSVIPFDHFINNDLAYLRGGTLSQTYATSVTKTKAADYGHVKWIEDLVLNTMWSPVPVIYDKYALWGISYWGRKRQQFYGFSVNRESTRDGDDVLYKFREGDFKRLRRQDIEDMLLLLVQGKLTNLSLDDRYALNVALRIDGTLNHVRTTLNDIATGIQMDYLPKRRWSPQDKRRARVMISAIDRKLRDRRLMRSLEKFIGGRPYGGDLRLLKRTILFIICCPRLYKVNPST